MKSTQHYLITFRTRSFFKFIFKKYFIISQDYNKILKKTKQKQDTLLNQSLKNTLASEFSLFQCEGYFGTL